MFRNFLLGNVFSMRPIDLASIDSARFCSMSGSPDAGGGGGGGDGGAPAAATSALATAKAADAAPAAGDGDGAKKDDAGKAGDNKDQAVLDAAKGAKKEGEPPPDETPEAKAKREGEEKAAKEAKTAETLKGYDALKLPKGITKENEAVTSFLKTAAENGMPLEQAQRYLDDVTPKLQAALEAPYKAWETTQTQWIKELKEDTEIGGSDLQKNLGFAAKALDTFAGAANTPEGKAVRDALEFTGAGNNPAVARMMVRMGKAIRESGPVPNVNTPTKSLAALMYPTMSGEAKS